MMFLVIFGLRGLKHEREARVGLRCAADLQQTFSSWKEISAVSFGISTGKTYCGLVGHALRREYSVIGVAVNRAARLMIAYPNVVSCEEQILLESKLDAKYFSGLPRKSLKGVSETLNVFEFNEIIEPCESPEVNFSSPMLCREKVVLMAHQYTANAILLHNKTHVLKKCDTRTACFLIRGDMEEGKTRLLKEIYSHMGRHDLNRLFFYLSSYNLKNPFDFIRKFFRRALKLTQGKNAEQIIRHKLASYNVKEYLHCLNPILNTKFPVGKGLGDDHRLKIMKLLCNELFPEFHVIFIDDACLMDMESFKLLDVIFNNTALFTFMTLGRQRRFTETQKELFKDHRVVQHYLEALDNDSQVSLACSTLEVDMLTPEFVKFLNNNSDGVPGWIESYLLTAVRRGGIRIKEMSMAEALMTDLVSKKSSERIFKIASFTHDPDNFLVTIARTDNDLMTFDSLTTHEQLVCKCAAVIGLTFTRDLLFYVLSSSTDRMVGQALVKLFEQRIISCMSKIDDVSSKPRKTFIRCNCKNVTIFSSCRDLPSTSCCTSMTFQRERFRNLVYNSLTEKQRIQFHAKALLYLHMETRKCAPCKHAKFPDLLVPDWDFKFYDGILEIDDNSLEKMVNYFDSINLKVRRDVRSKFLKLKTYKLYPIILNFFNYNFCVCSCQSILLDVYTQMIRHCHGGRNSQKLIHSKIQLAAVQIATGNICDAQVQLTRASNLLDVSWIIS
jgi:adenylate cyclase 10